MRATIIIVILLLFLLKALNDKSCFVDAVILPFLCSIQMSDSACSFVHSACSFVDSARFLAYVSVILILLKVAVYASCKTLSVTSGSNNAESGIGRSNSVASSSPSMEYY